MGCPSTVEIGDNLVFSVCTHDPETGILTDAAGTPNYRIYKEETLAPIATGVMAKLDDGNTTGFYTELIACTLGNGFETGKSYTVYIEATVDGNKGGICYGFRAVQIPTADNIKTTLETDGSKLDHLWEMTEDDGGVRRLTENALEESPAGDCGGPITIKLRKTS